MRVRLIKPRHIHIQDAGDKTHHFIPDQMFGHLDGIEPSPTGRTATASITWDHGITAVRELGDAEWSSQPDHDIEDEACPTDCFVYDPM